jgi:hypothetical protein
MSVLEGIGWVLFIAILLVIVFAWWWLVWVCVGYLMDYWSLPGGLLMQVFLWFVVQAVIGGLARLGTKSFTD